jgi:drug/metabolite transporter (DMT)-like permease
LIVFILATIARSGTNLYSTKFTSAVNVQLVSLSTPFIVSIMSLFIVNRFVAGAQKEFWNWKSFASMALAVLGGAIIIIGGAVPNHPQRHWYDFFTHIELDFKLLERHSLSYLDILGMGLALFSSMCLSIYMIALRFMRKKYAKGYTLSENSLFVVQQLTVVLVFFIPSILLEDWTSWKYLTWYGWLVFIAFSIFVYLVARALNIYSIQILGPATSGSMLAIRLIATIIFAEIFLKERLKSVWQVLGSIIVIIGVSLFIYNQNKERQRHAREEKRRRKMLSLYGTGITLAQQAERPSSTIIDVTGQTRGSTCTKA